MKPNKLLLNLIVALAVSVIVNFAYLLSLWIINNNGGNNGENQQDEIAVQGVVRLSGDGYGYIISEGGAVASDSVYVSSRRVRRFELKDGMIIQGVASVQKSPMAKPELVRVEVVDGAEVDYSDWYKRPDNKLLAITQIGFYLLVAFVLCTIITSARKRVSRWHIDLMYRLGLCLIFVAAAYFVAPIYDWHHGRILFNFMAEHMLNPMILLQMSFSFVVCALYGLTWNLLEQRSAIRVEMEHLKTEALEAQYAMLVNQINPHFLFNSLNTLSMLVREGDTNNALGYIDRLSYTFRYIIGTEGRTMVSLDDELKFLDAYRYLLEVRYADKLFFDIEIADDKRSCKLPALSLQPLIENVVKHNIITTVKPLTVTIKTEGNNLVVSNPIAPKLEAEESTGIGLSNLTSRWTMLAGKEVKVSKDGGVFSVVLPLTQNS